MTLSVCDETTHSLLHCNMQASFICALQFWVYAMTYGAPASVEVDYFIMPFLILSHPNSRVLGHGYLDA